MFEALLYSFNKSWFMFDWNGNRPNIEPGGSPLEQEHLLSTFTTVVAPQNQIFILLFHCQDPDR